MAAKKDVPPDVNDLGQSYNPETGEYEDPPVPESVTGGETVTVSVADLDALIAERMQARDLEHQREIEDMQARIPSDTIPMHGAGPGLSKRRSWSLAEQEAAHRGELPDEYYAAG